MSAFIALLGLKLGCSFCVGQSGIKLWTSNMQTATIIKSKKRDLNVDSLIPRIDLRHPNTKKKRRNSHNFENCTTVCDKQIDQQLKRSMPSTSWKKYRKRRAKAKYQKANNNESIVSTSHPLCQSVRVLPHRRMLSADTPTQNEQNTHNNMVSCALIHWYSQYFHIRPNRNALHSNAIFIPTKAHSLFELDIPPRANFASSNHITEHTPDEMNTEEEDKEVEKEKKTKRNFSSHSSRCRFGWCHTVQESHQKPRATFSFGSKPNIIFYCMAHTHWCLPQSVPQQFHHTEDSISFSVMHGALSGTLSIVLHKIRLLLLLPFFFGVFRFAINIWLRPRRRVSEWSASEQDWKSRNEYCGINK